MFKERFEKLLCFIFTMKLGQFIVTAIIQADTDSANINILKPPLKSTQRLVVHTFKFLAAWDIAKIFGRFVKSFPFVV